MSLELCILASGSAGNCSVLRTPAGVVLIDAGLGPRATGKRLDGTGVLSPQIRAVCLTHLDHDHFNTNWVATLLRQRIRVHCHARRADELIGKGREWADARRGKLPDDVPDFAALVRPFDVHPFDVLDGVSFRPVALAHDLYGSHGFVIDGFGQRIGYATDLGRVPAYLIDLFEDLDIIALESNYDPDLQRTSGRPWFLRQRITGGRGHLSNEQAFQAVCAILDRAEARNQPLPSHIVLLHRSRECNCPDIVRSLFSRDARVAARLTLSEQSCRSEWLRARTVPPACGEQLALAFQSAPL